MYKGYELALKRNAPVSFKFKGVETTLYPDQQTVDDNMIDIRIKDVLKELKRVSNVSKHNGCSYIKKKSIFCIKLHYFILYGENIFLNPFFSFFNQNFKVPSSLTVSKVSGQRQPKAAAQQSEAAASLQEAKAVPKEKASKGGSSSKPCSLKDSVGGPGLLKSLVHDEEIPEFKEKKRLMNALMECDKRIHQFESCLLNLHDGNVSIIIILPASINRLCNIA